MRIAFNRIRCHGILFPAKGFPQKDSRSHGCTSCHLTGRSPAVVLPSSLLGLSPLPADLEAPLSPLPFPVPSLKPRPPAPPGSRCGVRPPHPPSQASSVTRANWSHWAGTRTPPEAAVCPAWGRSETHTVRTEADTGPKLTSSKGQ